MSSIGMTLYRRSAALLAGRGLRRYPIVNRLNARILKWVRPREALVLGHQMLLDRCDSLELGIRGVYEPLETRIATELVPSGGCVVDIGANIGYYTLLCARAAGPLGQVYAFEPEAENFGLLRENVRRNGYHNVQLENVAVSDATGRLSLFVCGENRGDHRVYSPAESSRSTVSVKAIRLDDYFADDPPLIDLLKMDVQGAEGRALEGMRSLLKFRPPRAILTEFWPQGLQQAGSSPAAVLSLLETNGYELSLLDEHSGDVSRTSAPELLRKFTATNGHQTNLLARHD